MIYMVALQKNNINSNIIKWSIINSLSTMNRFLDKELLYSLFEEYDGRNVTPKYFIGIIVAYMKKRL